MRYCHRSSRPHEGRQARAVDPAPFDQDSPAVFRDAALVLVDEAGERPHGDRADLDTILIHPAVAVAVGNAGGGEADIFGHAVSGGPELLFALAGAKAAVGSGCSDGRRQAESALAGDAVLQLRPLGRLTSLLTSLSATTGLGHLRRCMDFANSGIVSVAVSPRS